jgi:lipopolysaccharide biosynthesis protein
MRVGYKFRYDVLKLLQIGYDVHLYRLDRLSECNKMVMDVPLPLNYCITEQGVAKGYEIAMQLRDKNKK